MGKEACKYITLYHKDNSNRPQQIKANCCVNKLHAAHNLDQQCSENNAYQGKSGTGFLSSQIPKESLLLVGTSSLSRSMITRVLQQQIQQLPDKARVAMVYAVQAMCLMLTSNFSQTAAGGSCLAL